MPVKKKIPPSKRIFPDSASPRPSREQKRYNKAMLLAGSIHLQWQGLSSPSEGEGFTLPSEVEGENEEEQDEDEAQTIGAE